MTTFESLRRGAAHSMRQRCDLRTDRPMPSANPRPRACGLMRCTSTPEPGGSLSPRCRRDGGVARLAFGGSNRQVELLKNRGRGVYRREPWDMARFCVRALPYIAE